MSRQIVPAKKILLSLRLKRYKNWIIILGHIREGKNKPKQHNPHNQPLIYHFEVKETVLLFVTFMKDGKNHMLVIFTIFHESNKIFLILVSGKELTCLGFL